MVAQAFIDNPLDKPQVNHINGIKSDNRIENLEWVTQSENVRHAFDAGLEVAETGGNSYRSKLTVAQALFVKENPDHLTSDELAEMFSVSTATIRRIQRGDTYRNVDAPVRKKKKQSARVADEVRSEIRVKRALGLSVAALAKEYDLGRTTVRRIITEAQNAGTTATV